MNSFLSLSLDFVMGFFTNSFWSAPTHPHFNIYCEELWKWYANKMNNFIKVQNETETLFIILITKQCLLVWFFSIAAHILLSTVIDSGVTAHKSRQHFSVDPFLLFNNIFSSVIECNNFLNLPNKSTQFFETVYKNIFYNNDIWYDLCTLLLLCIIRLHKLLNYRYKNLCRY